MVYYLTVLARIIIAPLILVWPTNAIILSFILDLIDADFAHRIVSKKTYQSADKLLDTWVYLFEMDLAWAMFPKYKYVLFVLFLWRLIGLFLFLKTGKRWIFLYFGNFFENIFFLLYFSTVISSFGFLIRQETIFFSFLVAIALKVFQEWFIHVADLSVREDLFKSKRSWKNDKINL